MCSTVPVNNSQSVNSQNCAGVARYWVDVRLCPQLCPQLLYYFMLQVIISIAFTDFNSKTTVIFILHNNHLLNASISGPLEDITTINISYNARLEFLELEMPLNSSLETLILSNNNLTTVSPEWFIDTPNLTEISLANNRICEYMSVIPYQLLRKRKRHNPPRPPHAESQVEKCHTKKFL